MPLRNKIPMNSVSPERAVRHSRHDRSAGRRVRANPCVSPGIADSAVRALGFRHSVVIHRLIFQKATSLVRKHCIGLALIVALSAQAANLDVQWDNGALNNDWGAALNWSTDALPDTGTGATGDKLHLNLPGADRAIYSAANGTNTYQTIRIGDAAGGGELEFTGGSLKSDGTAATDIATGGRIATLSQSGGTLTFGGYMQVGLNANSVGNINLSGGTLISSRNGTVAGVTAVSISLGDGNNAQGNIVMSGGELRTRTGILLGANGGKGRFEVRGAGVANVGTDNTADDGFWVQTSGSTLAAYVTNGTLGTIFVDNLSGASGTYSDGNVIFMPGSLLEVGFLGAPTTNSWDLMNWEGALLTNGLAFAPGVTDTNWSFEFVDTGGAAGVDTLRIRYGPLPPPPPPAKFVHPGVMHTLADLERMRTNVLAGNQPWLDGYNAFSADSRSSSNYSMQGPFAFIKRGGAGEGSQNLGQWENDCGAAYQNAIRWHITGQLGYANKAMQILNGWAGACTNIIGSDARLTAGLQGHKFITAAEIIRHTGAGWPQAQINTCSNFIRTVLLPHNRMYGGGNWGNIGAISQMAAGVFMEDEAEFNDAVNAIKYGAPTECDMGMVNYINPLGWTTEADRDIGHWALGLMNLGAGAQIAWCQGVDLWSYLNYRLQVAHEYMAQYNLSNSVPYAQPQQCDGYNNGGITFDGRGRWDLSYFELSFHPYENLFGIASPWIWAGVTNTRAHFAGPDGNNDGIYAERYDRDHVAFGTLVSALPAPTPGLPLLPIGLSANASNGVVTPSWSAATGATGYNVKRATARGGPYTNVASVATTSHTDATVANGQLYFYKVSATNAVGETADSGLAAVYPSSTTLAAPSVVVATAISHERIDVTWKASVGATSYNVARGTAPDGPFTNIASGVGTTFLSYANTGLPAATTFHYVVAANNAIGAGTNSAAASATTLPALPSPWTFADAGYPTTPGHATYTNGAFTVKGAGLDYGGLYNSDAFGFAYLNFTGNGEIIARFASRQTYSTIGKIGLAMRESLGDESRHAFVYVGGDNTANFVYRNNTGNNGTASGSTNVPGSTLPRWLKMNRTGNVFTGSVSVDGTNWTVINSRSINMSSTLLAGFAVCSRNNGYLDTAVFDNVSVTGVWPPSVSTAPVSVGLSLAGNALQLSWPSDHTGWRIEAQTNSIAVGIGTNWFTVSGSDATNQIFLPINPANGSVFLRLVYP